MPKEEAKEDAKAPALFEAHEPFYDQRGAVRLDRPFNAAEARQLDEERAAEYERQRRQRFPKRFGPPAGPPTAA